MYGGRTMVHGSKEVCNKLKGEGKQRSAKVRRKKGRDLRRGKKKTR